MENVNLIKKLLNNSKLVSNFINVQLPKIKDQYINDRKNVDKHRDGWSINGDEIQSVNIKLSYSSFSGSYGNSSTYSDLNFDTQLFAQFFVRYLNKHTVEIFNEVSEMMENEAISKKELALAELKKLQDEITEITEII